MIQSTINTRRRSRLQVECSPVDTKRPIKRSRRVHLTVELEQPTVKVGARVKRQVKPKVEPKIEPKEESSDEPDTEPEEKPSMEKEVTEKEKSDIKQENIEADPYFPENFNQIYDNIKTMRTWVKAPVDTMEGHAENGPSNPEERFLCLFSLMISSRTRDTLNIATMKKMKKNGLNLQYVLDISEKDLAQELKPVNFYVTKAKNLKKTAEILVEKFNGDIPKTIKELVSLPGVGPKMGYLCLKAAWDITAGIGVDTHVHRLSNLFKWVRKPTKEPEDTRKDLESWLPKNLWDELNTNLVGFGQTICNPYKPKCEECLNNQICPGAFKQKTKKSKSSP